MLFAQKRGDVKKFVVRAEVKEVLSKLCCLRKSAEILKSLLFEQK